MNFQIELTPTHTTVRPVFPEGAFDDFRPKQTVAKLVTSGTEHIVFDLARVGMLDARGLGQIIGAMICAVENGTRFTLRNVTPALLDQLTERGTRVQELEAQQAEWNALRAETTDKLDQDIAFAVEAGILGTPFILVNGRPSSTYLPFLYALGLTAGDARHPVFASLPPPVAEEPGHEGHGH